MLHIKDYEDAKKFHEQIVSEIFDDIINRNELIINKKNVFNNIPEKITNFLKTNQSDIISGKPEVLKKICKDFDAIVKENEKLAIKMLFTTKYTAFQKVHGKEFLNKLGIDTCVYCNRNYTLQIVDNRVRAQLDHFYPKDIYPILALSFHNLIPSCSSCNHIKLKDDPEDVYNPYEDGFSFAFSFNYSSINTYNVATKPKEDKSANTLKFFKIKEIYDAHAEKELKDLIDLRIKYNENYLEKITKMLGSQMSNEEAHRLAFGIEIEEKNYHKRPFSKFKKDILIELGIIESK